MRKQLFSNDGEHSEPSWPKVVEDMRRERHQPKARSEAGLIFTCFVIACVVAVACVLAGCAVSLSFQPATWQPAHGKAQSEVKAQ